MAKRTIREKEVTAMIHKEYHLRVGMMFMIISLLIGAGSSSRLAAQSDGPTMLHPRLAVRTVVDGLAAPTSLAFLGPDDILVLEKNTGRVQRIVKGVIQDPPVLDLPVNFGSERGLLGIALHPDFP